MATHPHLGFSHSSQVYQIWLCTRWMLHPRNWSSPKVMFRDTLVGESFNMAKTFGNEFVMGKLDYPAENFRVPSWIHERNKN